MFKKILRLGIHTTCFISKFFPQTLLVSLASEFLIMSSRAMIKYAENKKSPKSVKALEKIGDNIITMSEALANHNEHQFTKSLVQEIKKKAKIK